MSSLGPAAYLVVVAACVALAAAALSRWVHADALDRALVVACATVVIPVGLGLTLGAVGALSAGAYLAAAVVIGSGSAVVLVRSGPLPARAPAAWSMAGIAAVVIGGVLSLLALVPTLAARRTEDVDTYSYHINNLAAWVTRHTIWELPFQNTGFFTATHPGNGELFSAPFFFATSGDQLIYVGAVFFGALCVIAAAAIARDLDRRPEMAALAALAVAGVPIVFGTQTHSLSTDLAATAGVLAGIAGILRARRTRDARWVAVAGCALGFALGTKYTVLLLVPLVALLAVAGLKPRRLALWMLPGGLLAAPWFARNLVQTGNPIFPQGVNIAGRELLPGGTGPFVPLRTPIIEHLASLNGEVVELWTRVVIRVFGPALVLVVAGAVLCAVISGQRRRERAAVGMLAVAAFVVYLVTPYTGGGPEGLAFLIGSNIRYAMPAAFLGAALAPVVLPARLLVPLSATAFAYNGWQILSGYGWRGDLVPGPAIVVFVVLAATAALAGAILGLGRRRPRIQLVGLAPAAAVVVAVVAISLARIDGTWRRTDLERVLSRTGRDQVLVVGLADIRSVLGPRLDGNIRTVSAGGRAGETPPRTPAELDAAVGSSDAAVLVVGEGTPGIPADWTPPAEDYRQIASTQQGDVYERVPEEKPTSTAPSVPATPPPATPEAPEPPAP